LKLKEMIPTHMTMSAWKRYDPWTFILEFNTVQ